jgi:hypothetical protein
MIDAVLAVRIEKAKRELSKNNIALQNYRLMQGKEDKRKLAGKKFSERFNKLFVRQGEDDSQDSQSTSQKFKLITTE